MQKKGSKATRCICRVFTRALLITPLLVQSGMKDIYHSIAHHSTARTIQQICSPLADKYCRIVRSESQYAISVVNIPNTGCGGVKQEYSNENFHTGCGEVKQEYSNENFHTGCGGMKEEYSNENFHTGCGEVKGCSNEYLIQAVLGWSEARIF